MDTKFLQGLKIDQIGLVVRNVERTIKEFDRIIGLKGFKTFEYPDNSKETKIYYKGKAANFRIKVGFVNLGDIELELIQPLSGTSIYKDFLSKYGSGMHHFRISLNAEKFDDLCTHLMKEGIDILSEGPGVRSTSRWIVFDTRKLLGTDLEIKQV